MYVLLPLAIILLRATLATCCHSFEGTNMTVISKDGEKYHTVVTGCAERKTFEDTIVEIHVQNQKVKKLESDAVRHLRQLLVISFTECRMEVVEAGVFRNVPNLREVRIVRNELKEVVKGAFSVLEQLEVLDLSRNEIGRIESGAIGNSTTLREVYLGFNKLEVWVADWFDNATNIKVMDFQHNKIKVIPRKAFYNLHRIKKICFDFNELELIHEEAFSGITHLKYLGLRYNRLKSINPRIFPNLVVIDKMRIDANHLNFLARRLLAFLEVKEMTVSGNPWKCPCLDQINSWLYENNGTTKDSEICQRKTIPVCCFPSTFSHTCREAMDDEVTRCYLEKLQTMAPPLDQYCARLDGFL